MNRNFARFLSMVAIFGIVALVLNQVPAVSALKIEFHGWQAYAMLVLAGVSFSVLGSYAVGFLRGAGLTANAVSNSIVRIALKVLGYTCFAGILVAIGNLVPARIEIVNPVGLYWLFGALGFGYALCDIVEERFFPKEPGSK